MDIRISLPSSYVPVITCGWVKSYRGIFAFCLFKKTFTVKWHCVINGILKGRCTVFVFGHPLSPVSIMGGILMKKKQIKCMWARSGRASVKGQSTGSGASRQRDNGQMFVSDVQVQLVSPTPKKSLTCSLCLKSMK